MASDLTVILEDKPGTIADVAETLGKAGINIDGLCGIPIEDKGYLHILVDNATAARNVLVEAGFDVLEEREVIVWEIENRPGTLGSVSRRIANAGANIELIYVASNTRIVIGADDLEKARAVL